MPNRRLWRLMVYSRVTMSFTRPAFFSPFCSRKAHHSQPQNGTIFSQPHQKQGYTTNTSPCAAAKLEPGACLGHFDSTRDSPVAKASFFQWRLGD